MKLSLIPPGKKGEEGKVIPMLKNNRDHNVSSRDKDDEEGKIRLTYYKILV